MNCFNFLWIVFVGVYCQNVKIYDEAQVKVEDRKYDNKENQSTDISFNKKFQDNSNDNIFFIQIRGQSKNDTTTQFKYKQEDEKINSTTLEDQSTSSTSRKNVLTNIKPTIILHPFKYSNNTKTEGKPILDLGRNKKRKNFEAAAPKPNSDNIVFPDDISVPKIHSTTEKQKKPQPPIKPLIPVRNLEKCPGNQYYYPGEPWFCDCGPKYIFYKPKNDCFLAYLKGPCKEGQYLIVATKANGNRDVVCTRNPCPDGLVLYQGKCYEFPKSGGPCQPVKNVTTVLDINPSTLKIECIPITENRVTLISIPKICPPGSKRDSQNICRENWNVI